MRAWLLSLLLLGADPCRRLAEVPDDCEDLVDECQPTDTPACLRWIDSVEVDDCDELTEIPAACGCP